MNKKGFTLVELLATLFVLSLVLGISIFGIFSTLENAKKKTEREFLTQLSNSVETYIDLCLSGMAKNTNSCNYIMRSIPQDVQYAIGKISKSYDDNVPVYKDSISVKINFYNIVNNENILVRNDFVNPVNSKDCYEGATIDFYRDGDYVYYYSYVSSSPDDSGFYRVSKAATGDGPKELLVGYDSQYYGSNLSISDAGNLYFLNYINLLPTPKGDAHFYQIKLSTKAVTKIA